MAESGLAPSLESQSTAIYRRFLNPNPSSLAAYLLAPCLVGLVGWFVYRVQHLIINADHGAYAGPSSIVFLLPITVLTLMGGKGPGILTMILSIVACGSLVLPIRTPLHVETYSDIARLGFMTASGSLLIAGIEALRESARTQSKLTAEITSLHQRSLRVATAFQERLLPHVPTSIHGLSTAHYYRPALDEAVVGGDFLDVFDDSDGRAVMVLGDISGKGLVAATQISVVRNMLRLALHRRSANRLERAITEINDTIAGQNLLTGFATVFVGVFDASTAELRYVSCGHEAGLLLRAGTGRIEELMPTGPILGAFNNSRYGSRVLELQPGDVVALYTDGLTECGPTHQNMFGCEGMKSCLSASTGDDTPQSIVDRIIAAAKSHSAGHLSDDACLLICKLEEPLTSPSRIQAPIPKRDLIQVGARTLE